MMKKLMWAVMALYFLSTAAVLAAAAPDRDDLSVEFQNDTVIIRNVSPGARVAVLSVAREMSQGQPPVPRLVRRTEVITDDDRDGVVRLELGKLIPRMAMWAFVDMNTGASIALPTPGYEPPRLNLSDELVKHDNAGQLKKLDLVYAEVEILLVRPGTGAWRLNAAKYSQLDESKHSEDPIRLDVESMLPVGDSPNAPHSVKPGDVIAIVDLRWMQYGIMEVGK
ncbi:MAG: hypothetical protein QOH21_3370 [Acidobacteriota bacterium]|jgi:hypothetical protein|nr:hypothetical protein [Acidobacteriota bacterium]